jgi:hypothetical protein
LKAMFLAKRQQILDQACDTAAGLREQATKLD